mgnify:CR=1 FL=1
MAKVAIKSEKLSPFRGMFSIMEQILCAFWCFQHLFDSPIAKDTRDCHI